jgi:hypothetical protein
MARFYEKKPSFEVVRTGGLTEIRVSRDSTIFSAYACILMNFRQDLFRASINWGFPVDTFLAAFDSLVNYFIEVFSYTYDFTDEENIILHEELLIPLSDFLNEVDQEFGIIHFQGKVATLEQDFLKRTEKHELTVKVANRFNVPINYARVDFYKLKPEFVQYKVLLDSLETGSDGIVKIQLYRGKYEIGLMKYKKSKVLDFDNEKTIEFHVFDLFRLLRHYLKFEDSAVDSSIKTKKIVEILKNEERKLPKQKSEQETASNKGTKSIGKQETMTTGNVYGYRFVVPKEVYSNAEYREYLNYAKTMKSVKVIIDEYYKKHKKHWWNKS